MPRKTFTDAEVKRMERRAKKYIESPEGEKAIRESMLKAMKTIEYLQESRKVTWEQMYTPMTI